MTINLSANSPRVSYTVSEGATTSSFTVSFEFFAAADLNVYVDGATKVLGSGSGQYAVSGGDGSTGAVALSVTGATGGSTVVITRDIGLERTTDFPSSGAFQISTLNTELDRFVAISADLKDSSDRALQISDFDPAVSLVIPAVATRKGTVLGFNASTGAVEAGPDIATVQSLADVTTAINLLGTSTVVEDLGILGTDLIVEDMAYLGTAANVAAMAVLGTSDAVSDMNTLGTSTNVTNQNTLAGIAANITSVAGVASLITSDFVTDLNVLATSDIVTDLNVLATSDIVTDLNVLATTDIVADLAILATSDVVADLAILATSDIVTDLNVLATSDIVTDLNVLATSDIVADLALLATTSVVSDLNAIAGGSGIGALTIDNITIDGDDIVSDTHLTITTQSSGDINFKAAGGQTRFLGVSGEARIYIDNAATPSIVFTQTPGGGSAATTTLKIVDPTAARTILFPDASDTLVGKATTDTLTNKTLTTPVLNSPSITGDTSTGDNAAIGYTSAEGLILTGQGSTGDVTIKNDADAVVLQVPTGTTNVNIVGNLDVDGSLTMGSTTTLNSSGILQTAAQTNITSVGTLTALTVDYINIDSNIISTTGSNLDLTLTPHGSGTVVTGTITLGGALKSNTVQSTSASDDLLLKHNTSTKLKVQSTGVYVDGTLTAITNTGAVLDMRTGDNNVTDGDVLGKIIFSAPYDSDGTDALLTGAAIEAVAEGTFAADNNATELVFKTGASEVAATKMTLSSGGNLTITGKATANELDLTAIATDIDDTALDVFIYDTANDSDSGRWRKRTQHTSWYNEAASATRGSRKEFPAVAVIVAEAATVTIYDGDDPDLPMWMVFNGSDTTWFTSSAGYSTLAMLNGILCAAGNSATNQRLRTVRFLHDDNRDYATTGSGGGIRAGGGAVVDRNSQYGFNVTIDGNTGIVDRTVNDVAMTVLPNAPIDAATGLPVPTIAIATAGGLSVINNDGTVTDSATAVGIGACSFNDAGVWYARNSSVYYIFYATHADYQAGDGFGDTVGASDATQEFDTLTMPQSLATFLDGSFVCGGSAGAVGIAVDGLWHHDPNTIDFTKGMSALTTSSYNTGWQNGDIKLATLSDTSTTNVTGAELVTNGTFASDTTGWTAGDAASGLSVVSAKLRITNNDATPAWTYQGITTVVGKVYTTSITYTAGSLSGNPRMYLGNAAGSSGLGDVLTLTSTVPASTTFTATATTTYLTIDNTAGVDGVYADYDNISVRLAEDDRSVNGNGLQVFGTITKDTVVATGADLVAYSGFSASNYLQQPYNADLQFGTGDFCFSYWIKFSSVAGESIYSTVGTGTSSGTEGVAANTAGSGVLGFAVYNSGLQSGGRTNCGFTTTPSVGVWHCVQNIRRAGVLELWIDGRLTATAANTDDINATDSFTRLGGWSDGSVGDSISLSLFRVGKTAPSPEQIAKIYNDEKFLFQAGAQSTLHGTSDAVTALAHDDATDLLHVGTSAGRSTFQGLRRVANTTAAVSVAISASNGLVVED